MRDSNDEETMQRLELTMKAAKLIQKQMMEIFMRVFSRLFWKKGLRPLGCKERSSLIVVIRKGEPIHTTTATFPLVSRFFFPCRA